MIIPLHEFLCFVIFVQNKTSLTKNSSSYVNRFKLTLKVKPIPLVS